jgi:methylamine dehydrogenase light chain
MSIDKFVEGVTRDIGQRSSRRSFLAKAGAILVGAAAIPLLPINRVAQAANKNTSQPGETDCDYWRYCSTDGNLCTCCGGSMTQCPPGSEPSVVSWIGTCLNPADGRSYLVSYNDCCGMAKCNRCYCGNSVRERPAYHLTLNNDINWCMANDPSSYSCTLSTIVGVAE